MSISTVSDITNNALTNSAYGAPPVLKKLFIQEIISFVTVGYEDDGKEPMTPDEIKFFLEDIDDLIDDSVSMMIESYKEDGEEKFLEEECKKPSPAIEHNWIREFIHEDIYERVTGA